jgi:hypothetical protein
MGILRNELMISLTSTFFLFSILSIKFTSLLFTTWNDIFIVIILIGCIFKYTILIYFYNRSPFLKFIFKDYYQYQYQYQYINNATTNNNNTNVNIIQKYINRVINIVIKLNPIILKNNKYNSINKIRKLLILIP